MFTDPQIHSPARLTLSFLGTFEARLGERPVTHYQSLLAYLALNNDRAVPRDVLAAMFWPDEPESAARHNLRQALYELRAALADSQQRHDPYLLVSHHTVGFNSNSDFSLDVSAFLSAIEAHDLETAVDLYHGDLLPGFTIDSLQFEAWLRQEREGLHQLALEAMSELAQEYLHAGKLGKAQTVARRQLALEPWREIAFRQLMQAYAKAGDRANAMTTFEKCQAVLSDELGIAPSPETTALYEDIAAGRFGIQHSTKPLKPPRRPKHNLPAETTPFVGREVELAEIARLQNHEGRRLVTITGPGGMGKSRLALAAGARLLPHVADGVYFVDLAPLAEPEEIMPAIAATLDYQSPDRARPLAPQLLETLGKRHMLLILDNFEHLLPGAGSVTEILSSCPQVSLLVTSRQLLNLASESRYELAGLEFPTPLSTMDALAYPAVQLFLERASHAQPSFTLGMDNAVDVIHICELVQGMPLALVLAAAWLGLLSPAEIAAEIEQNLDFLSGDLADLPPRQRSMQAVFEKSWQMMTTAEQVVLARLSVFRGGFTREAASQVAGANLRILLSLMNKSLIQRQGHSNRFVMHELLRQYAAQQRRLADPEDLTVVEFCRYFARLTTKEMKLAAYWMPMHMPQRFAAERDNFPRAWDLALQNDLSAELVDLIPGMTIFSFTQGVRPTAMFERAVQTLRDLGRPETDSAVLSLRLYELMTLNDYQHGRDQLRAFIPFIEEYGDLGMRMWAYYGLGEYEFDLDNSEDALAAVRAALQLAAEQGEDDLVMLMEVTDLWYRTVFGEYGEQNLNRLRRMLAYFEPDEFDRFACYAVLAALGEQSRAAEAYVEAILYQQRALNIAKRWQDLGWISLAGNRLAYTYVQMGLLADAGLSMIDLLDWHLAIGQKWQTLGYLYGMSRPSPGQMRSAHLLGPQLIDTETAVSTLSLFYHHPESNPLDKQQVQQLRPQLEEQLGEEAFAAAWERGRRLDFETAVEQMRESLQALQ